MKNKKEIYINGDKSQFVMSEDKEFIIRYTSPSFIYYEEQKEAADSFYTHERRLNHLFQIMMNENYSPEEKNDMAHCIMCVKW